MSRPIADRGLTVKPLALYGGTPVRDRWLPYGHHSIDQKDIEAVVEALRSEWITQGLKIEEFEKAVADCCGAQYGVAFSSGTAALHAACAVAGLGPGDEAITTPLTFVATANAIVYCGAKPIFADVQADTLNINPAEIERHITSQTKAILPVDFAGQPADLDPILILAKKHSLWVIEDACHALGAAYMGRRVGSMSDMTVFSFHPVKHITTGEGGMVLMDDRALADGLRRLRHHAISCKDPQKPWQYEISTLGYNYRLSDIQCALGLSQLQRLDAHLRRRQEIASEYHQWFSEIPEISLPSVSDKIKHAWHLFIVLLNLSRFAVDRDGVIEALRAENIGATMHYPLVHLHPFYRERFGYCEGTSPVAEEVSEQMVTLPLYHSMTDQDVKDVITAVEKVVAHFCR